MSIDNRELNTDFLSLPPDQQLGAAPDRHKRLLIGGAFVGMAAAAAFGMSELHDSETHITADVPFIQEVQDVVSNIDDGIKVVGEVGLVGAFTAIGGVKIASRWNPTAKAIDFASSREASRDGKNGSALGRRVLRATFAGSIPVLASVGAGLGAFTGAIGTEVSEGPSRPIEAFGDLAPGQAMIVQYDGAMPMVQSSINPQLGKAVQLEAARRNVPSTPIDLNLGSLTRQDGQKFSDLTIGVNVPEYSPLAWKPGEGCKLIPVAIDKSAGIEKGEVIMMNGISANVVDTMEDASAINRIGITADREAVKTCLNQNPENGDHAIVLDTTPEEAGQILAAARTTSDAPAAVITKDQYKANSEEFWVSNVKPITNVLAIVAGLVAVVAIGANVGARTLRNRNELAMDLVRKISSTKLRAAELLRATKDGALSSMIGVIAATTITPVASTIVAGFRAGVGYKEAMMGVAVGVGGTLIGAASSLLSFRKTVNPKESTR